MYAEQLPKLQAEEELRHVNAVAAGSGSMKDHDRRRYLAQLGRQAGRRKGTRPKTLADWQQAGIPVIEGPKREE